MSEREQLKQIIDRLPEYKISYIANLVLSIDKTNIEEVEPDEWDLEMIAEAEKEDDGTVLSFEKILEKDGLTYEDLQD